MRRVPFFVLARGGCRRCARTSQAGGPKLLGLRVTNGSTPFLGDGRLLTTVSPNGDGFRDAAHIYFRLTAPARVSLQVVRTDTCELRSRSPIDERDRPDRGAPFSKGAARSSGRRSARHAAANLRAPTRRDRGRALASKPAERPVVRVQGIDAGFLEPSYAPGQEAAVTVSTDAKKFTFQVFAYGGGAFPSDPRPSERAGRHDVGGARRLVGAPRRARFDPPRAAGRLAERAVLPARHRRRRTRRVCTVHREAPNARQPPRRRRARNADVAGVQLRRRERRRLG